MGTLAVQQHGNNHKDEKQKLNKNERACQGLKKQSGPKCFMNAVRGLKEDIRVQQENVGGGS